MAVRRASAHMLTQRSLHIRIVPRPANLSESREIYRVLKTYGEMDVFKHLRYEYHNPADNIAMAIYRNADSAQAALDASPIRFALERTAPDQQYNDNMTEFDPDAQTEEDRIVPETSAQDGIDEILRPSQLSSRTLPGTSPSTTEPAAPANPPMPLAPPPVRHTISKWFQITVDRSRVNHMDFVERQPFWKQFSPMKSMAQEDLEKIVPHRGLSDISKRPPNQHRTPTHVLRLMNNHVEHRMESLEGMWVETQEREGSGPRTGME